MKFRCRECGAIFYSDGPLRVCDFCGKGLQEITPAYARLICPECEAEIKVTHGIPICNHFVLNNAPGNRCFYSDWPRRCAVARLPEYQPRTGIVLLKGGKD